MGFIRVQVVHRFSNNDTAAPRKKSHFILSVGSDFHMVDDFSSSPRLTYAYVYIAIKSEDAAAEVRKLD